MSSTFRRPGKEGGTQHVGNKVSRRAERYPSEAQGTKRDTHINVVNEPTLLQVVTQTMKVG